MADILLTITVFLFLAYAGLILYYARAWQQAVKESWQMADGSMQEEPSTINYQPSKPKLSAGGWQTADEPSTFNLQPSTFLTVLIPARNEAANIRACLDSILQQDYPKERYEVLVIDDHSTDETAGIVESCPAPNLRLVRLAEQLKEGTQAYKKKAIETGIRLSNGELIVTTDADCRVPPHWLRTIAAFFEQEQPAFIAMPVAFQTDNRPLSIFQSLDFMTLQGITAAAVHKGIHSMCNGANLAYTRTAFDAAGGFKEIDHIASGDDMLLMHKIAQRFPAKIKYLLSKEVIVETMPMKTLQDFFRQRIRWASKSGEYKDKRIFGVLLLVYLFNLMMLVLPVVGIIGNTQSSIFNIQYSIFFSGLLLAKTIVELIFLIPVARFFGQQRLLWFFPLAQPFHIAYTVIAGWLGKFGTYQWKDREVK